MDHYTESTLTTSTHGWHADPSGRYQQRYFDGQRWTDHVANHGQVGFDPVTGLVVAGHRVTTRAHRGGSILAVVGAVVVAAAAFMPWARVWRASANGIEADGRITLALAIIGGAFGLAALVRSPALLHVGTLIGGALIALIGVLDLNNVLSDDLVQVEHGLWLTLAGAAVMIVGGATGLAKAERSVPARRRS